MSYLVDGLRTQHFRQIFATPQDDKTPKKTPPPATYICLPNHVPRAFGRKERPGKISLFKIFRSIRTYDNIKAHHAEILNLKVNSEVSLDRIVPSKFLPPSSSWEFDLAKIESSGNLQSSSPSSPSSDTLSNGAAVPGHEVYYIRKTELLYNNDDAYNAIGRQPDNTNVRAPAKIVHFRKFFESLLIAGTFWDTSRDNFPLPETSKPLPEDSDNDAMDIDQTLPPERIQVKEPLDGKVSVNGQTTSTISAEEKSQNDATNFEKASNPEAQPLKSQELDNNMNVDDTDTNTKSTSEAGTDYTYTGRRTSTGSHMPENILNDLVRNFVEPIVWCFGCRADIPRRDPRLQIQTLLIPVRLCSVIYRAPRDRIWARAGFLEGPLLGVHCRKEPPTAFNRARERIVHGLTEQLEKGSIDQANFDQLVSTYVKDYDQFATGDLLREVGAMLLLGQEREREGREEVIAGKQKWWAQMPRWGGGSGGERGTDDEQKPPTDENVRRDKKRKIRGVEAWKGLQGPASRWDKKVMYSHIGKSPSQDNDHIYLISAIHHHISILHLRLHPQYLNYLLNGPPPSPLSKSDSSWDPFNQPWYILPLERSRWFDLFVPEDRLQAMRCIWGILGYLMRDVDLDGGIDVEGEGERGDEMNE